MISFTPRTVVDQEVVHPFRYILRNVSTGETITVDLTPSWVATPSEMQREGTDINKAYLQPIENFLSAVGIEVTALESDLSALTTKQATNVVELKNTIANTESTLNGKLSASNARIAAVEAKLPSLAPLVNPVLTNATVNAPAQTDSSTLAVPTSWVQTKLNSLMAAYRG